MAPKSDTALRKLLSPYLAAIGIPVQDGSLRCPNPEHPDPETSAEIDGDRVTCGTCATSWDIFDVAGLLDGIALRPDTYTERVKHVRDTLAAHAATDPSRVKPTSEMTDDEWAAAKARVKREPLTIDGANGDTPPADYGIPDAPFRVLGCDNSRGWYIGRHDTVVSLELETLGKTRLMQLADIEWWTSAFEGNKGRLDTDRAVDWLVGTTRKIQFSPACLRGRGAWRDPPVGAETIERLLYHDGEGTLPHRSCAFITPDPNHIYQRKPAIHVLRGGVADVPASPELRAAMRDAAKGMAFATEADFGRLIAWAAIAPFCGALPWRPAGFLTGESGWGKSTIVNTVVRPLLGYSVSVQAGTGGTTEAGIRQRLGNDASPVVIEEAECHTEADRVRVSGILALMRQSVMDGSPEILKGTPGGHAMSFATKGMFLFVAITQGAEHSADIKRMFRVDLRRPDGSWDPIRERLRQTYTAEHCAQVRAHTWQHLTEILAATESMTDAVIEAGAFDSRKAALEAVLWATYWIVWRDGVPDADTLRAWLQGVYAVKPPEHVDGDAHAMLESLLDQDVPLHGMPGERYKLRRLLREMLHESGGGNAISADRVRGTLDQYGLWVMQGGTHEGSIAIPVKSRQIAKIIGHEQYANVLERHPMLRERRVFVNRGDAWRAQCMLFSPGVLEGEIEEMVP